MSLLRPGVLKQPKPILLKLVQYDDTGLYHRSKKKSQKAQIRFSSWLRAGFMEKKITLFKS